MSNNVHYVTLTAENFETEVLQSPVPVIVDFWAAWCGPCRVMNPVVESTAEEFAGVVKVGKLNIDDYPDLATDFHIEAIPTLLMFYQGEVIDRISGVVSQVALSDRIQELLDQYARVESVA
ncbi:MAG: thioredoxin [Microcoleaceae cyanobacterium]